MSITNITRWNTKHQYGPEGQRIVALVIPNHDVILFHDIDRGLWGSVSAPNIFHLTELHNIRLHVMHCYDNNQYKHEAAAQWLAWEDVDTDETSILEQYLETQPSYHGDDNVVIPNEANRHKVHVHIWDNSGPYDEPLVDVTLDNWDRYDDYIQYSGRITCDVPEYIALNGLWLELRRTVKPTVDTRPEDANDAEMSLYRSNWHTADDGLDAIMICECITESIHQSHDGWTDAQRNTIQLFLMDLGLAAKCQKDMEEEKEVQL